MKLKKRVIKSVTVSIALILCLLFLNNSIVYAYSYYSHGHTSCSIEMTNKLDSYYTTAYTNAKKAWNDAITEVYIRDVSNASEVHEIYNEYIDDTYNGIYYWYWLEYIAFGRATIFGIILNDTQLRKSGITNTYIQGTIVHELGHALCLDDNPSDSTTPNASIMNYSRNRTTIYKPQADDISGVKNAYNLK